MALLLFSVKVTNPAMLKQNRNSSRNCENLHQKSSWRHSGFEGQTSARPCFVLDVEHISRLLMFLRQFFCTKRISSIPYPLRSRTRARKKNEPDIVGNLPGCDLARMQSAVSHSTDLSALSALVLHLPQACSCQILPYCIKRTSLDRTYPLAFNMRLVSS